MLALSTTLAAAQKSAYSVQPLTLPQELADKNNQFSGLYRHGNQLLLLSESRLQERAEAKVYAVDLASVDAQLRDKSVALRYRKYAIRGLEPLRARMDSACQHYEGLEAITLVDNTVYLTVETTTPSAYGYLLRGALDEGGGSITLEPKYLVPVPKPALTNGAHISNAGFEALTSYNRDVLLLFEYNYFAHDNYAYRLPAGAATHDVPHFVPVARLPFRLTDLVYEGNNRFVGINYFYKGDDDSEYRTPAEDANTKLIQAGTGYKNYSRLIRLEYKKDRLTWKPLFELPAEYQSYNLEGIAAYNGGYFLINDKYGPSNQSTLLYLQKK
ncbi:hypothetical protein B0919_22825 [Hymenobacter sp. CRA2]|nr:hypothetical protein B0919_22825 [Hymenobacter sp. CRA2]